LDGLTNNENKISSFYMRALFWIFPFVLLIGKKGEMIKRTKQELGEIASRMWRDAKVAGDAEGRTLMALMRKNICASLSMPTFTKSAVRADSASGHRMDEDEIVSQMRTTISAGYETVSAIVAVSRVFPSTPSNNAYL
jgi:cytochrome P450